ESGLTRLLTENAGEIRAVITGEGCTDAQTESGKLCAEVAALARNHKIPCILLSGGIGAPRRKLMENFTSVFISGIGRTDLDEILSHAREDLQSAAESLAAAMLL
ncbi:MAG: glycerate kinase, partial [Victivallales bacterium]|nr:glycerate kinase [Victivallales bacterium]